MASRTFFFFLKKKRFCGQRATVEIFNFLFYEMRLRFTPPNYCFDQILQRKKKKLDLDETDPPRWGFAIADRSLISKWLFDEVSLRLAQAISTGVDIPMLCLQAGSLHRWGFKVREWGSAFRMEGALMRFKCYWQVSRLQCSAVSRTDCQLKEPRVLYQSDTCPGAVKRSWGKVGSVPPLWFWGKQSGCWLGGGAAFLRTVRDFLLCIALAFDFCLIVNDPMQEFFV